MRVERTFFYSDNLKLDAAFFSPEAEVDDTGKPLVIVCSGFTGLNNIHPERFARALTKVGYPCFGFDYRGFAKSEGEVGAVLLEEQVRDISNAVSFVLERSKKQGRKLVLAGWGMAGGLILEASKVIDGVDGLIAMNGFYNSFRVQKQLRGLDQWKEFKQWFAQEKARLARGGERKGIDPFRIYPLDSVSKGYVDAELRKNPDYGLEVYFEFADSLLGFEPEASLSHLADVPILIAHGDQNALHPVEEATSLFDKYPGEKELYWMKNAGHTEWMFDDHPTFIQLAEKTAQWIQTI